MYGGSSTNTIQASPTQDIQAQILGNLAPLIQQYGQSTMPGQTQLDTAKTAGLNSIMPNLTQMLQSAASGTPSSAEQQSLANNFQGLKQQFAKAGAPSSDPRIGQAYSQGQQAITTGGNMPELQTIMSLFGGGGGMNPSSALGMMGGGSPAGSTQSTSPSLGSEVGSGLSTATLLGMMASQMGIGGAAAGIGGMTAAQAAAIAGGLSSGAGGGVGAMGGLLAASAL